MKKPELKEALNHSAIGQNFELFTYYFEKNKKLFKSQFILIAIVSFFLASVFTSLVLRATGTIDAISLFTLIKVGFARSKIMWLVCFAVIEILTVKFLIANYKPYTMDKERRFRIAEVGESGTAHFMNDKERATIFDEGTLEELDGNILGLDKDTNLYATLKTPLPYGINYNALYVGPPGTGKSRCLVIPEVYQIIKRGDSCVVTDPKGELYRETAQYAKENGYTVKVLNFDSNNILHSDSFNFMSVIEGIDTKADAFADTLVTNTTDVSKTITDFWTEGAINLCKALVLYVSSGAYTGGTTGTLGDLVTILNTNTPQTLYTLFTATENVAGRAYFNIFNNGTNTIKESTMTGLAIKLSLLTNPIISRVVSTDGINIRDIGREKSLYYICMDDQRDNLNYLVALFFSLLYQELVDMANKQMTGKLPINVWLLYDEFRSVGRISNFPKRLSNVRSRGIYTTIIIQDLTQLQEMYEKEWESIVNCCSTVALLGTGSAETTAKFFSNRSGEATIIQMDSRHDGGMLGEASINSTASTSEAKKGRMLLTQNEIQTMDINDMLVCISQYQVKKFKKLDCSAYPQYKNATRIIAAEHVPDWYRNLDIDEFDRLGISDAEAQNMIELAKKENELEAQAKAKRDKKKADMPDTQGYTESYEDDVDEDSKELYYDGKADNEDADMQTEYDSTDEILSLNIDE